MWNQNGDSSRGPMLSSAIHSRDEEFDELGRDAVYHVRALQMPTAAINGADRRTRCDEQGRAPSTRPCSGNDRTVADDRCFAPARERAWSSSIFVDRNR